MHTFWNIMAGIGVIAIALGFFVVVEIIKSLEDGYETGGDHRTEEEREKDGSI